MINLRERWHVLIFFFFLGCAALVGCVMSQGFKENSVVRVSLGMTSQEVQELSSYNFGEDFISSNHWGLEFIDVPHMLIYSDADLHLEIPVTGVQKSLATHLNFSSRLIADAATSQLQSLVVFGTSDYVRLSDAIERGKELQDFFLDQGFSDDVENRSISMRYRKKGSADINTIEELESAFLDSDMYISEALVFRLSKNKIAVRMLIRNARRMWGGRDGLFYDPDSEKARMTHEDLIAEKSYNVEIELSNPLEP